MTSLRGSSLRGSSSPPILTLAEEHSLMTSLRGSSLRGSSSPPILTLAEEHSLAAEVHASALEGARAGASEGGGAAPGMAPGAVGAAAAAAAEHHAERACITSAVLSGWPTLEDGALSALASASATSLGFGDAAAELELLELLLWVKLLGASARGAARRSFGCAARTRDRGARDGAALRPRGLGCAPSESRAPRPSFGCRSARRPARLLSRASGSYDEPGRPGRYPGRPRAQPAAPAVSMKPSAHDGLVK
jgi:hypothetical protein